MLLLLVNPLQAEWKLPDSFQIHGFASQAFILSTDNNFFGGSKDNGTFDFRELGINASWRILPRLQVAAQGVARWAGENDEGSPRLDYGLVDYAFVSNAKNTWGLRLGRVINPIGFYNDTRDVAFTRPSIFLPQSIYFDRTRDVALSADGGQVYGEQRTSIGDLSSSSISQNQGLVHGKSGLYSAMTSLVNLKEIHLYLGVSCMRRMGEVFGWVFPPSGLILILTLRCPQTRFLRDQSSFLL